MVCSSVTTGPASSMSRSMKLAPSAAQKYLVRQVAPAHDREGAIGHEELVVHAVVEPTEIGRETHPAVAEWSRRPRRG
jgi:hypothetical protein